MLLLLLLGLPAVAPAGEAIPAGETQPEVMRTVFADHETMHFAISWTGGIKIGDLYLELRKSAGDVYEIRARVTDFGLFRLFYPVDDLFVTQVRGPAKLPFRYDVLQREGRGRVTRRLSLYDQEELTVTYRKNEEPEQFFSIAGPVHNEFSSFFATRTMRLAVGESFMVPTFADRKRNEVKVDVRGREDLDSPFGRVRTIAVMPIMKFRGLYDKEGDTVIWLTDDRCRVPVRIRSRILIGSLTADLESYDNPACEAY
ncbi:MAG: DUF3108 domain-containing protein [Desulfobulbaceae bacterium]